jgi:hypothetical protein
MTDLADLTESEIARAQTSRSVIETFTLGVAGVPIIGTGASSGSLAVADGPTLNVSVASLPVLTAGGSLSATTHTLYYPNATFRYTLGALEITQPQGAWVDLRNMLQLSRTTGGRLSLVVQAVNITSSAQEAGGSGEAKVTAVVTNVSTTTDASSSPKRVTLIASNVQAGAWRVALNRTLASDGLSGVYQDCAAPPASSQFCYPSAAANNSATRAELVLLNVAPGWSAQAGKVAASIVS